MPARSYGRARAQLGIRAVQANAVADPDGTTHIEDDVSQLGALPMLGREDVVCFGQCGETLLETPQGGAIFSYQDNVLTGNVTDGAPTAVLTLK